MKTQHITTPEQYDIRQQGKVVIEPADHGGLLMAMPDGCVQWARDKAAAERQAKHWFNKNLPHGCVGIGEIEWRS